MWMQQWVPLQETHCVLNKEVTSLWIAFTNVTRTGSLLLIIRAAKTYPTNQDDFMVQRYIAFCMGLGACIRSTVTLEKQIKPHNPEQIFPIPSCQKDLQMLMALASARHLRVFWIKLPSWGILPVDTTVVRSFRHSVYSLTICGHQKGGACCGMDLECPSEATVVSLGLSMKLWRGGGDRKGQASVRDF